MPRPVGPQPCQGLPVHLPACPWLWFCLEACRPASDLTLRSRALPALPADLPPPLPLPLVALSFLSSVSAVKVPVHTPLFPRQVEVVVAMVAMGAWSRGAAEGCRGTESPWRTCCWGYDATTGEWLVSSYGASSASVALEIAAQLRLSCGPVCKLESNHHPGGDGGAQNATGLDRACSKIAIYPPRKVPAAYARAHKKKDCLFVV